jgi:hypothetical protein
VPLIVKPNTRRMLAFRDAPSGRGFVRQHGPALSAGVGRLLAAVAVVAVIILSLKLLVAF